MNNKLFFLAGITLFCSVLWGGEEVAAQKRGNDILYLKSKKFKSKDYSIDKLKKTHRISKQWAKVYRTGHLEKSRHNKQYVRQLRGWECPSYKTFVLLRKKKLF